MLQTRTAKRTALAALRMAVFSALAESGKHNGNQLSEATIRRMTADLNFPLRIVVAPTLREADGLALSSRNVHLTPETRAQALALSGALGAAQRALAAR